MADEIMTFDEILADPTYKAEFEKLGRSMQYLLRKQNLLLPEPKPPQAAPKAGENP